MMLDPRTKLLLAIGYAALIVAANRLTWSLAEGGVLLLFIVVIGKTRAYLRWLRMVLPMSLFFGAVVWWTADVRTAALAALKLLTLTSVFFVFFSTTLPDDLGNSLVKVGMPYVVAFVLSTSLQFVPMIHRKIKNVMDAQRARGIPLEPGWSALRHYPAFLGPILIQAFQMAEELAEAMEARGFGLPGRTFLKDYLMQTRDWLALSGGLLVLIACLLGQHGWG
ncbi:MAG: energy-coupling factor transporter transmembrane protein EcfT [Proteobacteria bacterium]|nr:energy-coupling factor transporter transmembrane protein EcfT [Pseudomonadota bacterium]MBU3931554.1 energy-coupling factor transporter transmembrane protein EcfT [Pseudomonadota bacterium]MBU4074508.1 energy-coupling factor transporter transmembrane protein EcfT [Pseudomonadota bacterium]